MALPDVLSRGRAAEQARHLDLFEIRLPAGTGHVYDPTTKKTAEQSELLFTEQGRVKVSGGQSARQTEVGDRTAALVTRELRIRFDAPAIPATAFAVCIAVDPTSDPTLLGARLNFDGPAPGSQTTCRRLQVSEVIS